MIFESETTTTEKATTTSSEVTTTTSQVTTTTTGQVTATTSGSNSLKLTDLTLLMASAVIANYLAN